MILLLFLLIPLVGGAVSWIAARWSAQAARWVALIATTAGLVLAVVAWLGIPPPPPGSHWMLEARVPWISRFGITFHLALDGLSLILLSLTFFLGILSVLVSWREVTERVGFFHFNLLWVLLGVTGVFIAVDLFLFYAFWELMLVPMYFLIGIWGHERRTYAAIKFFIFTQLGGLMMLVSTVGLVSAHQRATGTLTFDYGELLGTALSPTLALWLLFGFLGAFLIKLPAVPLHTWLPDAHTQAPTAGSVVLAGLLLKTGAYGLLRFAVPLFPSAAHRIAPAMMIVGAVGIVYGAIVALAQTDLKRLVAYTSVSHLGFVLVGVFAWNELSLQGTVMQIVAHGLSTGGLFIVAGFVSERIGSRDITEMGGLWGVAPRLGGMTMVLGLASLGLPGLANFVAEFLILAGAFGEHPIIASVATLGLIAATIYALWLVQATFHGENRRGLSCADLDVREMGVMVALLIALVWLGLYPSPLLDLARSAVQSLRDSAGMLAMGG